MDRYIRDQNLTHYRKVLTETTDPTKRRAVLKLIADELAKARASEDVMTRVMDQLYSRLPNTRSGDTSTLAEPTVVDDLIDSRKNR
jgi:hypothetical protein